MARQRCFLSAMADQLDPVRAIRNFGSLAKTIETNVHTDIPLNRLPSLVRLVSSIDSRDTLTVTFGFDYFFGRQKSGNYPVPAIGRVRTTVRQAILTPELLKRAGKAKTAKQSC
jgi:anionic cell wall polymer biosynthesis LytR-Cps2A-Psr (LCP) family protein